MIIFSDLVEKELKKELPEEGVKNIFHIVPEKILKKAHANQDQLKEAIALSRKFKIPKSDALHAILARDNNATLITRDKHFYELHEEVEIKKPEDLL